MQEVEILDSDRVFRRVQFLDPNFIKDDGSPASSSYTLKKYPDGTLEEGLSVDLERLTTFEKSIQDPLRFRLFASKVEFIRSLGLQCVHDFLDDNKAHSLIKGDIKKSTSRALALNSIRIKYPD